MAKATPGNLAEAVRILTAGGLVAFPTETVYGLGADARHNAAVGRIFAAKGRPENNPLIVHVADIAAARRYAGEWSDRAQKLAEAFWPGPLTLVVPKSAEIVREATAGLESVGLRVPNHPLALELLAAFGGPVAAPSANRSGRVSPTTAEHVRKELGAGVQLILDGGPCSVGIESTVLNLTTPTPIIHRAGGVSRVHIEAVIGTVQVGVHGGEGDGRAMPSPGMLAVHYSPTVAMYRFERGQTERLEAWRRVNAYSKAAILSLGAGEVPSGPGIEIIAMPDNPVVYGCSLYAILHSFDRPDVMAIWAELPPDTAAWVAVRDRLMRASKQY